MGSKPNDIRPKLIQMAGGSADNTEVDLYEVR